MVFDNDEKVPSFKKNIPNSRIERKNHISFNAKWPKLDTLFMIKTAENHTLRGCTCLYIPYKGVLVAPG